METLEQVNLRRRIRARQLRGIGYDLKTIALKMSISVGLTRAYLTYDPPPAPSPLRSAGKSPASEQPR